MAAMATRKASNREDGRCPEPNGHIEANVKNKDQDHK